MADTVELLEVIPPPAKKHKLSTEAEEECKNDCFQIQECESTALSVGFTDDIVSVIKTEESQDVGSHDCSMDSDTKVELQNYADIPNKETNKQSSSQQKCIQQQTIQEEMADKSEKSVVLFERDAGISEYINDSRWITAIIKQRYSDFIVNEISETGKVVELTSTELPPEEPAFKTENLCVDVKEILSEEIRTQLQNLADSTDQAKTFSIQVDNNKERRQEIHKAVKESFPSLETKTEDVNGHKVIIAMHRKGQGRDKRNAGYLQWPESKSKLPYCSFVLYKENKDTMDVIALLAKFLKVRDSLFQYAGTKDRRAKTSQEITVYKVLPQKLRDLNNVLYNIVLGNFRYVEKPLRLGQLSGNRFTIVLRNVVGSEENLEKGLNSLKSKGFINYFGMQRFGTTSVPTHLIGRAILHGNWEEAIDLILKPRPDDKFSEAFRKVWAETKNPEKTLNATESRNNIERNVLRALCQNSNDYYGALQKLPRNTRQMYVHSYQSFVWNCMVSRRIKTYGLEPIVGDLVMPATIATEAKVTSDKTEDKVHPMNLNEELLAQYTIYDVVLPLPGHDIAYPDNEVHAWYKRHLDDDGFDIDNMTRKQKDYSLPGAYRKMVVRPADMKWQSFHYNDYTLPLALSDVDRMKNIPEPQSNPDGKLRALRLVCTLPASSYATMALRELLKTDTSSSHQSTLNLT